MNREERERQRYQKAAHLMNKAFNKFSDAMLIMENSRQYESWTSEDMEKIAKIVNTMGDTLLKMARKTAERKANSWKDEETYTKGEIDHQGRE